LKRKKLQAENNTSQSSIKEAVKLDEIGCKQIINLLPHLQADSLNLKQKVSTYLSNYIYYKNFANFFIEN
jgi:hypothetical protein